MKSPDPGSKTTTNPRRFRDAARVPGSRAPPRGYAGTRCPPPPRGREEFRPYRRCIPWHPTTLSDMRFTQGIVINLLAGYTGVQWQGSELERWWRPRDLAPGARTRDRQQFSGASSGEAGEWRGTRSVVRLSGRRGVLSYMRAQALRPSARPGERSPVLQRGTTLTMRDKDNARRKANEH